MAALTAVFALLVLTEVINCASDQSSYMSAPCQNDGWRIQGGDDYVCQCRVGYEGKNCENKVAFGLVVESDGDSLSVVTSLSSFAGKMASLCGNADGNPENDVKTSNGTNVKDLPNKYSLIGNSWQVEDQEDTNCETAEDTDPRECDVTEADQALAASYLENCRFDVCANMAIATSAKRAACGTLEAYSAQCSDLGYGQVDWRTAADCPLDCGPDMVYQLSAPACLPTCSKPNAPEECGLPKTESCVCADNNAVVVDGKCVSAQTCGCTDDNGVHYAIGAHWLNEDCTTVSECVVCQSCNRPIGEIVVRATTCKDGYYCSIVKGVAYCQLEVKLCYAFGDPHYRTFDGMLMHYQGVCRYNFASIQQHYPDLPYFRVLAKSEHRYGNKHVAHTRYVDVEVFGHTVRLDKGKKVYVDGVLVQLDATYPGFEITNNGRFVRLVTNFSLVVESDGYSMIVVKIPESFAGKMAGLCGNADGNADNDWRTSNGTNMKDLPNKYSLIGNSWQVEDQEDTK
ncbi:Zonadhesin [Lamellibrachia satsuma]|nr:Zonadhesin [Lamellibrachia satsuma]